SWRMETSGMRDVRTGGGGDETILSAALAGPNWAASRPLPDCADFDRTVVPLALITSPLASLESRAQARRIAARLDQFRRAEVDFGGAAHIGPRFAEEGFRGVGI